MKKQMKTLAAVFALALALAACGKKDVPSSSAPSSNSEAPPSSSEAPLDGMDWSDLPQFKDPAPGTELMVMHTSMGDIKIMLFPDRAPKAVENFVTLAKDGYYDGLKFHRVIDGFMIQGGDPLGTGYGGESIWGTPFEDEFSPDLLNFRGALSMANSGANTNGSQFFIVQAPTLNPQIEAQLASAGYPQAIIDKYKEVGGTPHLDFVHTVFGQVVEGMDVVDAIAKVEVGENDMPTEDVIIESITFETVAGAPAQSGSSAS